MIQYFVDGQGNYIGGFEGVHPPYGAIEVPSAPVNARDVWSNGAWVAYIPAPFVPQSVSRRQAKQALLLDGKLDSVQLAIDAIADEAYRGLAQIEWDDSQEFVRSRPMLIQIAGAIGLDEAGLDALFIKAATL